MGLAEYQGRRSHYNARHHSLLFEWSRGRKGSHLYTCRLLRCVSSGGDHITSGNLPVMRHFYLMQECGSDKQTEIIMPPHWRLQIVDCWFLRRGAGALFASDSGRPKSKGDGAKVCELRHASGNSGLPESHKSSSLGSGGGCWGLLHIERIGQSSH